MRKKTVKKKIDKKVVDKAVVEKKAFFDNKPILYITLKSLLIVAIVSFAIYYSDSKGYFNPDETNNHTKRKWDAFYDFSKSNNIDVLLLGNSHLYSGINPKNLSVTLGVNAFILASPGTNISDTYYGLKEALNRTSPKLVVIETYGINNFNPYKLKDGSLSDQFKSFYARKNVTTKLASTPFLFKSDNYVYAWSNTIRNHEFIFNDTKQLDKNKVLIKKKPRKNNKLYLGRYVRFQTGVEDDIMAKYDSLGAPVDGDNYLYSEYAEMYVKMIVDLCKEKDVELIFLTLPMYYKHIDNYLVWDKKIGEILNKYPNKWINMQNPYDMSRFTAVCFENTYKTNQHMTYNGSLIATYKLAEFIKSKVNVVLPNRKNEAKWNKMFYGQEGYFDNMPVSSNDAANKLICQNLTMNNVHIQDVSVLRAGKNRLIVAKIDRMANDISRCKLRIAVSYAQNNEIKIANIDLHYDVFHEMSDKMVFKAMIKPIDIRELKDAVIICK